MPNLLRMNVLRVKTLILLKLWRMQWHNSQLFCSSIRLLKPPSAVLLSDTVLFISSVSIAVENLWSSSHLFSVLWFTVCSCELFMPSLKSFYSPSLNQTLMWWRSLLSSCVISICSITLTVLLLSSVTEDYWPGLPARTLSLPQLSPSMLMSPSSATSISHWLWINEEQLCRRCWSKLIRFCIISYCLSFKD